ncbi:helix-turn-helix domain-containing protein [Streptomyces nondiastaticus]|uniref:helix-turn-helix domain-containing protein n=1 Tax=Streptomyces nondiastaticus TaxID=3154512 RepID=UPI003421D873
MTTPPRPSGVFFFSEEFLAKLMTVGDVADYLSVPKSWVYDNWKRQTIPFRKVGQSLRCRPADLEKWLDRQK